MKNGPKYGKFKVQYFNISRAQVKKEVDHIAPKIWAYQSSLQLIHPPTNWVQHSFEHVSGNIFFFGYHTSYNYDYIILGAIDCTSHFRCRVHPRQADWYRYDKAGFFITSQV